MDHEIGKRIEIFFETRQLLVGDMVYIFNSLTASFRHAVYRLGDRIGVSLNRNEYMLRLSDITHDKSTLLALRVAATKKAVALASNEEIEELRSGLTDEMFLVLADTEEQAKVKSFRKSMGKKAPRISNFTIRLIETEAGGGEKIHDSRKWK